MAYTKESIFSKVGELLLELNDGYTELSEKELGQADADLILLEAKAKFLTTHIEVLRQFAVVAVPVQKPTDTVVADASVEEEAKEAIYFTSPVVLDDAADAQPVTEEIEELDMSAIAVAGKSGAEQRLSEEAPKEEPIPVSTIAAATEKIVATPQALFTTAATQESQKPAEVETVSVEREPVVSVPAEEPKETVAAEEEVPVKVIVNEVIEEPKEIVIETPQPKAEEVKPARPLTLNEMLQQQRKAGFANPAATAPVASQPGEKVVDLKSVINLNDKLLFIKDLFNGYSLAYSEAIELLNRYSTFAEADVFLQTNYALKNNWGDKPQTVEKLYAVLRKKFMR